METTITLTITVTDKTEQEVREHVEDIQDEVTALFEIDLTSMAFLDSVRFTSKEVTS